jgi:hypothetical protein
LNPSTPQKSKTLVEEAQELVGSVRQRSGKFYQMNEKRGSQPLSTHFVSFNNRNSGDLKYLEQWDSPGIGSDECGYDG